MKVNKSATIAKAAIFVFCLFIMLTIAGVFSSKANATDSYTIRCVEVDDAGTVKTVYERDRIKDVRISERDGQIVYILTFGETGNQYDLVPVGKNVGCVIDKVRSW